MFNIPLEHCQNKSPRVVLSLLKLTNDYQLTLDFLSKTMIGILIFKYYFKKQDYVVILIDDTLKCDSNEMVWGKNQRLKEKEVQH